MSALFSKPKMPEVKDPAPLPDEASLTKARRRTIAGEVAKQGVAAQNLTASGARETLG